jgi:hypothetical protein
MALTLSLPKQLQRPALLDLLDPRGYGRLFVATFVAAATFGAAAVWVGVVPLWGATAGVLLALLGPSILKWRNDYQLYGTPIMVLSILVMAQGFHWFEHIAQWVQFHILRWPFFKASGLLSPANAEWVHFVWNWAVLLTVIYLLGAGLRNWWMWLLLLWAGAHTAEHSYMMVRYLQALGELRALGVSDVAAQGLPGFFGRDGWLATAEVTQNTFLCRLPALTTAQRLDVHFWWNAGETALLLPAANAVMANIQRPK